MLRKRMKKSTRRKINDGFQRVIRILFAFVILYMAVSTLKEGYSASFNSTNQLTQEEEQQQIDFIEQVAPVAQKMQELYGVRPSISIAQAILESDWGMSELAATYGNLYGIKESATAYSVLMETQEFTGEEWITIQDYFKIYDHFSYSIEDHARLMVEGTTWNNALYHPVIQADSYQAAAYALQEAGYATDPTYPAKVIGIIEQYELYQYDLPIRD